MPRTRKITAEAGKPRSSPSKRKQSVSDCKRVAPGADRRELGQLLSEPGERYGMSMVLPFPKSRQKGIAALTPKAWAGSSLGKESSLQQIAPFVGKTKCTMADAVIEAVSEEGQSVLDPFCGCGVIPLESLILGRSAIGNDLHPYAYTITRAKLHAPPDLESALRLADHFLTIAEDCADLIVLNDIPAWVRRFFHPRTLQETYALSSILLAHEQWFLLGCLLGILHHVRPGFLSYPASHLTPYLREKKYPRDKFAEMYQYRDVRSRLLSKVRRMYRRPYRIPSRLRRAVLVDDARHLSLESESVDAIVSSPPYFDALDYGRDNRLRLWFLGVPDYRLINASLVGKAGSYLNQMTDCLKEMHRVLRPGCYCALILGDVEKNGKKRNTAELLAEAATNLPTPFVLEGIVADDVPDERRSRRRTATTKIERILLLRKPR